MAGGRSSDLAYLKEARASINWIFNEASKQPQEQEWPMIVAKVPTVTETGTYLTVGDIGNAEAHTESEAYTFEGLSDDWKTELTLITYGKGVKASRRQMKDDQSKSVDGIFGTKLIRATINTKEQLVADAYNDGFSTAMADGVYVFSNTHPLSNAPGKYNDNLITGALTTDNIKTGIKQFALIRDQAGNRYQTKCTHLLTNAMEQFTVYELMQSQLMAYELSNTINSLNKVQPIGVIFNHYIDHTTDGDTYSPWFMLDKTLYRKDGAGCVYQYRGGLGVETDLDFKTKETLATAEEEYVVGFVSPGYGAIGSQNS